ncbi:adhesion G-protein coupled receptor G4-like isoform X2 [Lytechinus pictus]|uniref:adhesion G-protein coupled receptor G4-like isoform X2 n=1 Tax=Lytechinus pictus TaxID=7653 RepID=UPI0030B9C043
MFHLHFFCFFVYRPAVCLFFDYVCVCVFSFMISLPLHKAAPEILAISGNQTGYPGDVVFIACTTFGRPQPVVSFEPALQPFFGESPPDSPITINQLITLSNGTDITFTCIAENIAGRVTSTVQVTALDYRCPILADALADFQKNNLTECPSVLQLQLGGGLFQSFFSVFIPEDGILHSLPLVLFQSNPEIPLPGPQELTFRVTVTNEPVVAVPQRRKRDIVKILYERDYHNATLNDGSITLEFSPPVFAAQFNRLYYINLLTLTDDPLFLPFNQAIQGPLSYLQCPLSPPLNPVNNASCYLQLESWAAMEESFIELGCAEDTSVSYRSYETCLRVGDAQPVVTGEVVVPSLQLFQSYDIPCPIEGAVRLLWWRITSRGSATPFESPSPFLRFNPFTVEDMGYYYCEGYGGGAYRDVSEATTPVLLDVEGVTRVAFSVAFEGEFVDFGIPEVFSELAPMFRRPINNAFINDGTSRLSISLLDNVGSFEFPTIVNTRNGSTIVDYIINVDSSVFNGSVVEIVNDTTFFLESNLATGFGPESSFSNLGPESSFFSNQIVPGSVVVGSASSCTASVVTGAFGTLTFPTTPLDQTADSQERCNEYTNNTPVPRARRTCRGDFLSPALWDDPVLLDCFVGTDTNEVLNNIARAVVTPDNVTEYSYDVAEATSNGGDINAEGIRAISIALQKIVDVMDPSTEVTNNTLQIVDNVLGAPDTEFVDAVDVEAPTRILDFLEQQITLFQTQGDGNNLTIVGSSIAVVALQLPEASLLQGLGFAALVSPDDEQKSNLLNQLNENDTMVYFNLDDIPKATVDAAIFLPPDILGLLPPYLLENGIVPVTFLIFQTSKLFISPDQPYDLGGGRRLAVGTRIISATVEGAVIEGLPRGGEIETTFLELNVTRENEMIDNRTCVFWDKIDQVGRWSSEGCRREDNPEDNRIRCLCDHLTSFAVLLDVSGDVGLYALDVLGMIGCIISIICLVITLVTYLSMKKLQSKQPQRILINLCVALLGLYLVFIIGIDRRYPTGGCVVVGFLIHFFLLSSVSWMLVEAINMYLLFVKVLNASVSRFMLKASLCSYGLPLLVCIVTVAVDSSLYLGDGTYCFVKPGPALYYGVLLLVALLLATNFIIFGLVMQRLSCRKSVAAHKTNQASRGETWKRVQNAVAISVLLGLTWLFGFLAIGGARLIFNILFLVFNSLQGFFVFLMFCVRQKEVREQWVRWLHCQFGDVKPGQRRSDDFVQAKYKKTESQEGRTSLATSNSQGIQLSSGGTLSTNASSITT